MSVDETIKKIYEAHKSSGLFDDSFENVIFKLTNAYDYLFLETYRKARLGQPAPKYSDVDEFDGFRGAYRACIKFAFEDCQHGDFKQRVSLDDIRKYQDEMKETIQFNYIRNIIDRYRLKRFSAFENNDVLTFKHIESDRSIIYDAYSRKIADTIPGSKHSQDNVDVFDLNLAILNIALQKQEFQSKKIFKPAKHVLMDLIPRLVLYYLKDLDISIGNLTGKDYYLGDYLLVYCYLVAIGMYKTAYLISLRTDNEQVYQPAIIYPKERLVEDVAETVNMPSDVVRKVLKDMTYDYSFHKDRLTIYQPLFEVGDFILCSANMLFQSYIVDKVMKYFDIKGTNKADLTLYHRYRSDLMNHRMAYYLPYKYANLHTYENCVLKINGKSKSEIDVVAFDDKTKTAALVELKNYTPVDNEEDSIHKEKRINEAIQSRLIKDKLVIDNIDLFLKQNKIPEKYKDYKYHSLLVTNTSVGGVGIKESIKVVDEVLFYNLLTVYDGNLLETINSIETKEFFKMLESNFQFENMKHEYKGLKVEIIYK